MYIYIHTCTCTCIIILKVQLYSSKYTCNYMYMYMQAWGYWPGRVSGKHRRTQDWERGGALAIGSAVRRLGSIGYTCTFDVRIGNGVRMHMLYLGGVRALWCSMLGTPLVSHGLVNIFEVATGDLQREQPSRELVHEWKAYIPGQTWNASPTPDMYIHV